MELRNTTKQEGVVNVNEAIKDILSGGGKVLKRDIHTISYYQEEMHLRKRYVTSTDYSPVKLSDQEKHLIEYLEAEKVLVGTGVKFPCEVIVTGYEGFVAIIIPERSMIEVDRVERTCALAHETGHYLDYKFNYDCDPHRFDAGNNESHKRHKEIVAWKYAYEMLRELGFNEWGRFLHEMKRALMTYFDEHDEPIVDMHVQEISEKTIKTA